MRKRQRIGKQKKVWDRYSRLKSPQKPLTQNFVLNQLRKVNFKSNKGYRYTIKIRGTVGPTINGTIIDTKMKKRWEFTYIKSLKDVIVQEQPFRH